MNVCEAAKVIISQQIPSITRFRLNFDSTHQKQVLCTQQLAREVQFAMKGIYNLAKTQDVGTGAAVREHLLTKLHKLDDL